MALDQSLIDCIIDLRKISSSMGQGTIPSDTAGPDDYSGMLVIMEYFRRISLACGQGRLDESSAVDVYSTSLVIVRYASLIAHAIS